MFIPFLRLFAFFFVSSLSALLVAAQSSSNGEPKSVDVPGGAGSSVAMDLSLRKPVVEVKINGKGPFKLFLDTGAGATVLNHDLVEELKLPDEGKIRIGDPADPQGIEGTQNRVAVLEIGEAKFNDFVAVSWNRSALYRAGAPRGVLGMPLFRKLLLTLDYPNGKVTIGKGSLPAADGKRILAYKLGPSSLIALPLSVGGKSMTAMIDSGSQGVMSFPDSFKETIPLGGPVVEVGRGRTVGGEAIVYGAPLKGDVAFGEFSVANPNVTFFERLRDPIVGFGFLSPYAMTIDQANRRVKFEKVAAEAKAPVATDPKLEEYAGTYGVRSVAAEGSDLFLQRTGGPRIRLIQVRPDEFALDVAGLEGVRVKFIRSAAGAVEQISVLNPQGVWESVKKGS